MSVCVRAAHGGGGWACACDEECGGMTLAEAAVSLAEEAETFLRGRGYEHLLALSENRKEERRMTDYENVPRGADGFPLHIGRADESPFLKAQREAAEQDREAARQKRDRFEADVAAKLEDEAYEARVAYEVERRKALR